MVSRGVRSAVGNRVAGGATVTVYSVIVNFPEFASFYVEGAPHGHPIDAPDPARMP